MKLKTLLPKLNEESELEYNTEPILTYFFELRDSMEILNNKNIDRNLAVKYIKREALDFASKRGMHLSGEELQFIVSEIFNDLDIKPGR